MCRPSTLVKSDKASIILGEQQSRLRLGDVNAEIGRSAR